MEKIKLTLPEVRELAKEYKEAGGKEGFLLKRKVIEIRNGEWFIMQYKDLAGQNAVFNYTYQTDIPYTFWNSILGQVDFYIALCEKKEKERLSKLAEEQGL